MKNLRFNIHGDNIVECERAMGLIRNSFPFLDFSNVTKTTLTPSFKLSSNEVSYEFTFFPGYSRWNKNILEHIFNGAGFLREAADVIITSVDNNKENTLLALEYCSALAAGNNAWQRSGRAYSFAKSGIPYIYITEIGGFELDSSRNQKNRRFPNVAVPWSYLSYSANNDCICYTAYELSPAADEDFANKFSNCITTNIVCDLIRTIIAKNKEKTSTDDMKKACIEFISLIDKDKQRTKSIWQEALRQAKESEKNVLFDKYSYKWSKSITIETTPTLGMLTDAINSYGLSITKKSIPLAYVPAGNVPFIVRSIEKIYPQLKDKIQIPKYSDLVICLIAGFKPRGDDSRPDRGLLPLARMLFGENTPVLSIVYGPGKTEAWNMLQGEPLKLMGANGLWEAVLGLSNYAIVDSTTCQNPIFVDCKSCREYVHKTDGPGVVCGLPLAFSEHDVDSILHYLFRYILEESCFEGMCNPPGGDWSGISILSDDQATEYKWLNLPRVSSNETKRPDHVVQLFVDGECYVLAIESKEKGSNLESNIGRRLIKYIDDLFAYPPSAYKPMSTQSWKHDSAKINLKGVKKVSVGAFLGDVTVYKARYDVVACDILFGVIIDAAGKVSLTCYSRTRGAEKIVSHLANAIKTKESLIKFVVRN
ncbi:MAG: hypothetical protein AB7V04_01695 [Desulfomonilaceae bacterium]